MDSQIERTQLLVPQRNLKALTFCSADAQSINEWLQALPKANLADCAEQLNSALQELAQCDIAAKALFPLVEQLRLVVYLISNQIQRDELSDGILLSDDQLQSLSLCQELHENLLLCYKAIIDSSLKNNDIDAFIAAPVHRSISESLTILLLMLEHYRSMPERLWLEAHFLIDFAEKKQCQDSSLDDPQTSKARGLSILDQYKRMLLLSHCRSNQLQISEIRQVNKALCLWSPHGKLLDIIDSNCWFMVNTVADEGLHYALTEASIENKDLKGLDARVLSAHLKKVASSIDDNKPTALSKKLILHLASAWGAPTQRRHIRQADSGNCQVCYGSSSTHYYLSNKVLFDTMVSQYSGALGSGKSGFTPDKTSVWDDAHDAENDEALISADKSSVQFKSAKNNTPLYPCFSGSIVNTSASGFCLSLQSLPSALIIPGELIGIQEGNHQHWILACIRWVHIHEEKVILGAELLSANNKPCAITALKKTQDVSHYQRSFLQPVVPSLSNQPTLITPHIPFVSGMKFNLLEDGKVKKGQLLECIEATPCYSQFRFRLLGNKL